MHLETLSLHSSPFAVAVHLLESRLRPTAIGSICSWPQHFLDAIYETEPLLPTVKSPTILGLEICYLLHYVRKRTQRWALALKNKTHVSRQYAMECTFVSVFAGGFWPHWKQPTIFDFLVSAEHRYCGLMH